MKKITRWTIMFLILLLLGAFTFWCGYSVGVFERDWEKNHPVRQNVPWTVALDRSVLPNDLRG